MAHISIDVGLGASAPPVEAGEGGWTGAASAAPAGAGAAGAGAASVFAAGSWDQTAGTGEMASQARLHRITRAHALASALHGRCDGGNIGIGDISININWNGRYASAIGDDGKSKLS
jgi:hypothetical protein